MVSEEKFEGKVISARRVTIPNLIYEKMELEEGTRVHVGLSKGSDGEKTRKKVVVLVRLEGLLEQVDALIEMIRDSAENVFVVWDIEY